MTISYTCNDDDDDDDASQLISASSSLGKLPEVWFFTKSPLPMLDRSVVKDTPAEASSAEWEWKNANAVISWGIISFIQGAAWV